MRTLSQKSRARPDTSLYPGGPLLYAWSLIIIYYSVSIISTAAPQR